MYNFYDMFSILICNQLMIHHNYFDFNIKDIVFVYQIFFFLNPNLDTPLSCIVYV